MSYKVIDYFTYWICPVCFERFIESDIDEECLKCGYRITQFETDKLEPPEWGENV